jgi:hypothetical protein
MTKQNTSTSYRINGIPLDIAGEFEVTTSKETKQHGHAFALVKDGGNVNLYCLNVLAIGNVRISDPITGKSTLLKQQELIEAENSKGQDEYIPLSMVKEATVLDRDDWHWLKPDERGRVPRTEIQTAINSFGMTATA